MTPLIRSISLPASLKVSPGFGTAEIRFEAARRPTWAQCARKIPSSVVPVHNGQWPTMHEVPPTVLTERRAIMSLNFVSSSPSRYVQLYPCILSYKRLSLCKMGPSRAAKRPFVALAGQKTIEDCIPLESFDNILKEMKAFDEEREQVISLLCNELHMLYPKKRFCFPKANVLTIRKFTSLRADY